MRKRAYIVVPISNINSIISSTRFSNIVHAYLSKIFFFFLNTWLFKYAALFVILAYGACLKHITLRPILLYSDGWHMFLPVKTTFYIWLKQQIKVPTSAVTTGKPYETFFCMYTTQYLLYVFKNIHRETHIIQHYKSSSQSCHLTLVVIHLNSLRVLLLPGWQCWVHPL